MNHTVWLIWLVMQRQLHFKWKITAFSNGVTCFNMLFTKLVVHHGSGTDGEIGLTHFHRWAASIFVYLKKGSVQIAIIHQVRYMNFCYLNGTFLKIYVNKLKKGSVQITLTVLLYILLSCPYRVNDMAKWHKVLEKLSSPMYLEFGK